MATTCRNRQRTRSVGQATSRRSAGDASAGTFRSDIVFWPRLREEATEAGAGAKFQMVFCRGEARSENRPQRLMQPDQQNLRARRRCAFGAHANLQSIRILNRSDAIDSDHSLDARKFLYLSHGLWPRTRTIRPFFRFSCSSGSTAPRTWRDFTSCRSSRRSSRIRACASLGSHRERGARADRSAPVPAGRADRAHEMARSQEAPRIPAPSLTAGDRLLA